MGPSNLEVAIGGFINFVNFLGPQHTPFGSTKTYTINFSRSILDTWCDLGAQVQSNRHSGPLMPNNILEL